VNHQSVILIGGGGHALVVAETLAAAHIEVIGFFDDRADAPLASGPAKRQHLGPIADIAALDPAAPPLLLALGSLMVRRTLLARFDRINASSASALDPNAAVATTATIGRGTFVAPHATIQARAQIDHHAIINSGAIVEHECSIGINAHIAPGAVLGGRAKVGDDAFVGLGARVLPGIQIGHRAIVGAGAVVTRDVAPDACVLGVPARPR
jgi:sugar O-acyltransferase (sialic acid O-acetyltransferase NeuD family)